MKKMKEHTYGWYPSVRDIYLSKSQPTPYHLECLYKFRESGYHNPIVEPPEPAFVIRGITSTPTPPPSRPVTSNGIARCGSRPGTHRPKSVPVPKFRPVPKMNIPTPMQAWGKQALAETPWGLLPPASTPQLQPKSAQLPTKGQGDKTESKIQVEWPKQHAVGKYDKPHVITATGQTAAEEVFGTPLPPCEQGTGGDSGYVFIPTGDGGVEVHSPPPVYWPEPNPRPPTPQHYASSKASLCSSEGIADRKKLQEEYRQQVLKQQEEKKKLVERQLRFEKLLRQQQQRQPRPPSSASGRSEASTFRRERVKSATTHRTKPAIPQRPVFSARPASDTAICTQGVHPKGKSPALHHSALCQQDLMHLGKTITELELHRTQEEQQEKALRPQQPMNPPSLSPSLEDLMIADDRSPSPDYQEAVDKYGWRAQVHGDPHNIKKTTKRLPYTVKCEEPSVAPEPPKVHMECRETFFYNTIPRRKANFDVHQEWLSETLHAKRIELQKREGVNYRYKTFSFAY